MFTKNYCITSTCFAIKGYTRTALYDLPKDKYEFVPNSIHDFLQLLNQKSISAIYNDTPDDYKEILKEYLEYCLDKEYVLEIPHQISKTQFPKLNLDYESPNVISNVCVSINSDSIIDFEKIKSILSVVKCYTIQIVFGKGFDLKKISSYLDVIKDIGMSSMELIIEYSNDFNYETLVDRYKNISFIFVYSAPYTRFIKSHTFGLQQIFTSEKKFEITHVKSLEFFNVNITLFTESQKHNTYFNKKLYIGIDGEIKNAPLTKNVFGNINTLKAPEQILDVINTQEFKKYWHLNKSLIDVCKQCEFRHMCVDNRVPVQRNKKEWFMETECNYNPYIAKWSGEEGYKTLSECGVTSTTEKFAINRKKINAINKELWGDD